MYFKKIKLSGEMRVWIKVEWTKEINKAKMERTWKDKMCRQWDVWMMTDQRLAVRMKRDRDGMTKDHRRHVKNENDQRCKQWELPCHMTGVSSVKTTGTDKQCENLRQGGQSLGATSEIIRHSVLHKNGFTRATHSWSSGAAVVWYHGYPQTLKSSGVSLIILVLVVD